MFVFVGALGIGTKQKKIKKLQSVLSEDSDVLSLTLFRLRLCGALGFICPLQAWQNGDVSRKKES